MTVTGQQQQLSFTVDTHLLRELGALLVGRESTALLELVKNAYDADASRVTVFGEGLDSGRGHIVVSDDGNGMTFSRFRDAFLRIAGRDKERRRLSPRYLRRYTGAKGIGRLAAHKLASVLSLESFPRHDPLLSAEEMVGVAARLDWDRMESERESLGDLGDTLVARRVILDPRVANGTTLTLTGLRGEWPKARLGPFLDEIRRCQPSELFTSPLPEGVLDTPLLFEAPVVREHGKKDPGFKIELAGDFEPGDELWTTLAERADWIIEIDSSPQEVKYGITPTVRRKAKLPAAFGRGLARKYEFRGPHPNPSEGPFFQARILVTEGTLGSPKSRSPMARFARIESGVRVFLEGFRVLPYGSVGDDWLQLDYDYVRRRRDYDVEVVDDSELPQIENEAFRQLGNRAYYGAVLLTERGAPKLQALVNREGFVPDAYFEQIKTIVRTGTDLSVRARAALEREVEVFRDAYRQSPTESPSALPAYEAGQPNNPQQGNDVSGGSGRAQEASIRDTTMGLTESPAPEMSAKTRVENSLSRAVEAASAARSTSGSNEMSAAASRITELVDDVRTELSYVRNEQITLRTLAGVGTQYAAFIHEVNGLLGQTQSMRSQVDRIIATGPYTSEQLRSLRILRQSTEDLVQALTRQASYLTDVVGPDARRRRRRLPVKDRFESALRLLQGRIAQRRQHVDVGISEELKTPPIFPAELAIIFTNLLTNAVKFAGEEGSIHAAAWKTLEGDLIIEIANTGQVVAAEDRERFFRPFESTTVDVDVVLGQGMGLGLPIVRGIVEDYGGSVGFADPPAAFATAVNVRLPEPSARVRRSPASET